MAAKIQRGVAPRNGETEKRGNGDFAHSPIRPFAPSICLNRALSVGRSAFASSVLFHPCFPAALEHEHIRKLRFLA